VSVVAASVAVAPTSVVMVAVPAAMSIAVKRPVRPAVVPTL
jgi:hypothetical protein